MNEVQLFNFNGSNIRTLLIEDEPYFVATDVCKILGLTNPTVALQRLDEDERSKFNLGRQGETNIVNEYGLYTLILASRKPEAHSFKRWITHEVLPTIRKHGTYSKNGNFEQFASLPLDQQLLQIAGAQSERLDKVEAQVTDLVENRRIDSSESQNIGSAVRGRVRDIVKRNNWNYSQVRNTLFPELNGEIKKVFGVPNRGYIKSKDVDKVIEFINCWEPSSATRFKIKQISLFD